MTVATPRAVVVVKVGSSSLTGPDGTLSATATAAIVDHVASAVAGGARVVLVTSGAIAAGRAVVTRAGHDASLDDLQGLAAVGQGLLMARYADLFDRHGLAVAQILFTAHDFGERRAYLNSRRTLRRLLSWGVVPIVNENDTTATDEISLGENDRLAALVATLVEARMLLLLTDTDGIYSADPRLHAEASLIQEVRVVDAALEAMAGASRSAVGTGGMATKVAAAKLASWSGIPCVITAASHRHVVTRALAGEPVGTTIHARRRGLPARKVWIAFACAPRGRLVVDAGAVNALTMQGRSLLPIGVRDVAGNFDVGDAVEIVDEDGNLVAKGLARIPAQVLRTTAGRRADNGSAEAVHRDDMVVLTA